MYLEKFGKNERMFHYANGLFVSTFAGERSLFGQPTLDSAWNFVKECLLSTMQCPVCVFICVFIILPSPFAIAKPVPHHQIHYVPSLFIDPALYSEMESLDGAFNVRILGYTFQASFDLLHPVEWQLAVTSRFKFPSAGRRMSCTRI